MKKIIATLSVQLIMAAATPALAASLVGDGFAPGDGPDSPYYLGEIAPPSWQGRPVAISGAGAPTLSLSHRDQDATIR